jgi:hypothetical protein
MGFSPKTPVLHHSLHLERPIDFATEGLLLARRAGGNCGIRVNAVMRFDFRELRLTWIPVATGMTRNRDLTQQPTIH